MKTKKLNFVYITTNLINGKQYVGDHSCDDLEKDNYLGSGKTTLLPAIEKYGRENFKREILEFFPTKQEAFDAQEKYINEYNTLSPNGYNISPKGGHGCKDCWSEQSKNKLIGHPNWLKHQTPESRAKISKNNAKTMLGKHHSNEAKEKNRNAHLGKIPWNKGKKGAQIAWNKRKRGVSDETRKKLSESHKGKPHPNNRRTGFKYKKSKDLMRDAS
jgi:group I intron endonuclease